jgi:hypothetical protein
MIVLLIPLVFWITAVVNDAVVNDAEEQYLPEVPERELFVPKAQDIPNGSYNSK